MATYQIALFSHLLHENNYLCRIFATTPLTHWRTTQIILATFLSGHYM